jgi:hypothetical protein
MKLMLEVLKAVSFLGCMGTEKPLLFACWRSRESMRRFRKGNKGMGEKESFRQLTWASLHS